MRKFKFSVYIRSKNENNWIYYWLYFGAKQYTECSFRDDDENNFKLLIRSMSSIAKRILVHSYPNRASGRRRTMLMSSKVTRQSSPLTTIFKTLEDMAIFLRYLNACYRCLCSRTSFIPLLTFQIQMLWLNFVPTLLPIFFKQFWWKKVLLFFGNGVPIKYKLVKSCSIWIGYIFYVNSPHIDIIAPIANLFTSHSWRCRRIAWNWFPSHEDTWKMERCN